MGFNDETTPVEHVIQNLRLILVGNIDSLNLIQYLKAHQHVTGKSRVARSKRLWLGQRFGRKGSRRA